ncbi:MAG: hypothetical protein KF756_10800 [Acidobacteria bacterium]|nr:hypothetical protein [Acidobacteriota bacterium]
MPQDLVNARDPDDPPTEDTASKVRAVNWMVVSFIGFILIVAAFAAYFFLGSARDGDISTPANLSNRN